MKARLFLTAWILLSLHFATDVSRELYLVLSIAEEGSFRLDRYVGMHYDIFELPGRGAHHNANPGASMIAAIPYWICKPLVHAIENRILAKRSPQDPVPEFRDSRTVRARFYQLARERNLDVRFGLAGMITAVLCMAPLAAVSVVVMYQLLLGFGLPQKQSLLFSLLYLVGTPVLFRAAYLNQNLMVGVFGLFSFALLCSGARDARKIFIAGLFAGTALLCDYSGILVLAGLGLYALLSVPDHQPGSNVLRTSLLYVAGSMIPVGLLWWYQWSCFGNAFFPPQHSMAAANPYANVGYQGFSAFSFELFRMLLMDPRFGLIAGTPALLLSVGALFQGELMSRKEAWLCFGIALSLLLFFSCVQYTRIQWITGIRYLVAAVPFLFLLTAIRLSRMQRTAAWIIAVTMIVPNWALAMVRSIDVPSQSGPWDSVRQVVLHGPRLPWLTTIDRIYPVPHPGAIVAGLFLVTGGILFLVWRDRS